MRETKIYLEYYQWNTIQLKFHFDILIFNKNCLSNEFRKLKKIRIEFFLNNSISNEN